jgi:hypothetical protein
MKSQGLKEPRSQIFVTLFFSFWDKSTYPNSIDNVPPNFKLRQSPPKLPKIVDFPFFFGCSDPEKALATSALHSTLSKD